MALCRVRGVTMAEIKAIHDQTVTYKTDPGTVATSITWSPDFNLTLNTDYAQLGRLQTFIDTDYMRLVEPYWPLKTGTLAASMTLGTVVGSGLIRVTAPYARKQFYNGREPGESQTGALRGRMPHERCMADNLAVLMNNIETFRQRMG